MANTPNRGIQLTANQAAQYLVVNAFMSAIDAMLSNLATISLAAGDHTITADESKNLGFALSGTLTADRYLDVPFTMPMIIENGTSGAHTIIVRYDSGDDGVEVPQGEAVWLYSTGAQVIPIGPDPVTPHFESAPVTPQTIPNNVETPLEFDTNDVLRGRGIEHDVVVNNHEVKVTRAGSYDIAGDVQMDAVGTGASKLFLNINGTPINADSKVNSTLTDAYLNTPGMIYLESGSVITLSVRQTSGGDLDTTTKKLRVARRGG